MNRKQKDDELEKVVGELMKNNIDKGVAIYEFYDHSIGFANTNHKDLIKQIKEIGGEKNE